jgi:hypothetical protein
MGWAKRGRSAMEKSNTLSVWRWGDLSAVGKSQTPESAMSQEVVVGGGFAWKEANTATSQKRKEANTWMLQEANAPKRGGICLQWGKVKHPSQRWARRWWGEDLLGKRQKDASK